MNSSDGHNDQSCEPNPMLVNIKSRARSSNSNSAHPCLHSMSWIYLIAAMLLSRGFALLLPVLRCFIMYWLYYLSLSKAAKQKCNLKKFDCCDPSTSFSCWIETYMHDFLSSEPVWPPLFKSCPAGTYVHSCINLYGMVFVGLHHFASIINQIGCLGISGFVVHMSRWNH